MRYCLFIIVYLLFKISQSLRVTLFLGDGSCTLGVGLTIKNNLGSSNKQQ